MITNFKNTFLSNMYSHPITFKGYTYSCAEAAFQAQKNLNMCHLFQNVDGYVAKKLGKSILLRDDWGRVKVDIMYDIITEKFKDIELRDKLLATGNEVLIEGNTWGDTFWGMVKSGNNYSGSNVLGQILMEVRNDINEEINSCNSN